MTNNENMPIWNRGGSYPTDWPEWLRSADIEWCRVEIAEDGGVVWYDGVWHDGVWYYGHWCGGTWYGGTWRAGTWHDGTWRAGRWYDGTWCGGVWHSGEWCGGTWYDGVWHDGTWHDGEWHDGEWYDGTWHEGEWRDGTWRAGVWHDGAWNSGIWRAGTWCDGYWYDGVVWRTDGPPGSGGERMSDIVDIDFLGVRPRVLSRAKLVDTMQVNKDTYLHRYRTEGDSIVIDLGRGRQITIKVNQRVGGGER